MPEVLHLPEDLSAHRQAPLGCPMCDELSTVVAAIDIVIDGDQIASECLGCGRVVRPFSWHENDGLPECYIGRFDSAGLIVEAAAWYWPSGVVKHVPAIDPECPTRYVWPDVLDTSELARAILAHLVGLDVPNELWADFEADMIRTLHVASDGEWELSVDAITDWLAVNL